MSNITIVHAENNNQQVLVDFKTYEFEFTQSDLTRVIKNTYSTKELEEYSNLDSSDNNDFDMASNISSYWLFQDVELLIQDFLENTPETLIDHLQPFKA